MLLATLVILSLPHIIPLLFGRVTIDLKLPPSGTKSLLPNLKYLTPLTTAMQNGSRGSHLGDGQLKLISLSLLTSEPLIGREKEKQIISNWLEFQESPVQIVSIVGGPGVGKSAVALEVGHTLVQQGIAVHYVDMHNVSSRVHPLQISKPLEDWAKHVKDSTLLILDNCDRQIHTQEEKFQSLVLTLKKRFIKILMTSQMGTALPFPGHSFEEYRLRNLEKDQAISLLQHNVNVEGLTLATAGHICNLVDNMPLALITIAAHLKLKKSCNLRCVIVRLEEDPVDFFSSFTEVLLGDYPVITSIKLAFEYINPKYQMCGTHFAHLVSFDAATVAEHMEQRDSVQCLETYTKHSLLEQHKVRWRDCNIFETRICVSHQDIVQCEFQFTDRETTIYRLPRLLREYILKQSGNSLELGSTTSNVPENLSSSDIVQRESQLDDTEYVRWTLCAPALQQYGESFWSYHADDLVKLLPLIISRHADHIPLNLTVEVGVKAFYWGTPMEYFTADVVEFAVSSLALLDIAISNKDTRIQFDHMLAAYAYFNHKSLGIEWFTQTQCPNPYEAVSIMLKRKQQVEVLHRLTGQNDLAWSAYRSFYRDLFLCCMAAPESTTGCERLWEYWLKGIVGEVVASKYRLLYISSCEGSQVPVAISSAFRGLWYYSNNGYSGAKYFLTQELHQQGREKDCAILDIAIVMALYNMYEEETSGAVETANMYLKHLSDKLIDSGLPQYKQIYHKVIIPFYREVGKPEDARRMEELLKSEASKSVMPPHNLHTDCEHMHSYIPIPDVVHTGLIWTWVYPVLFIAVVLGIATISKKKLDNLWHS